MSGPVAIQALVTGLATGAAYGLIALGFALVFRLTGTLAFAHGDVVTGAVFVGVLVVLGTTPIAVPLGAGETVVLALVTIVAGRCCRSRCTRRGAPVPRCTWSAGWRAGWPPGC